jgi:hypothetical protein
VCKYLSLSLSLGSSWASGKTTPISLFPFSHVSLSNSHPSLFLSNSLSSLVWCGGMALFFLSSSYFFFSFSQTHGSPSVTHNLPLPLGPSLLVSHTHRKEHVALCLFANEGGNAPPPPLFYSCLGMYWSPSCCMLPSREVKLLCPLILELLFLSLPRLPLSPILSHTLPTRGTTLSLSLHPFYISLLFPS